jgi:hypothetical protein
MTRDLVVDAITAWLVWLIDALFIAWMLTVAAPMTFHRAWFAGLGVMYVVLKLRRKASA